MVIRACGGTSTEEGGVRRAGGGADDTCARAQPHRCTWGEGVKMKPARGHLRAGTAAHLPKRRNGLRFGFARRTAQAQAQAQAQRPTGQQAHHARAGCALFGHMLLQSKRLNVSIIHGYAVFFFHTYHRY